MKRLPEISGRFTPNPLLSIRQSGDVWVYFGSGDVNDPTASNAQEKMYAVKDNLPRTATYRLNDLENITVMLELMVVPVKVGF